MNCRNCNHKMEVFGLADAGWCRRCGSLQYKKTQVVSTPLLVERVRELRERAVRDNEHEEIDRRIHGSWTLNDFKVLGIDESIGATDD